MLFPFPAPQHKCTATYQGHLCSKPGCLAHILQVIYPALWCNCPSHSSLSPSAVRPSSPCRSCTHHVPRAWGTESHVWWWEPRSLEARPANSLQADNVKADTWGFPGTHGEVVHSSPGPSQRVASTRDHSQGQKSWQMLLSCPNPQDKHKITLAATVQTQAA